jgi:signal transduction histidine kinase
MVMGTSTAVVSILVVEDNDDHRMLIERRLSDAGYRVRTAGSGAEAIEMLEGTDIVLLDYRLPGMTGLEALEAIRQVGGPSVVMVTGMGSESIAVEAMRAGAIDYVVKDSQYLQSMPQIVERAWRHHDLARRAEELQRLALLVTSASDRDTTFHAVVNGARRLLRADTAALFVAGTDGLALEAVDGAAISDVASVQSATAEMLAKGEEVTGHVGGDGTRLLVALPARDGGPLGALALLSDVQRYHPPEEVSLAATFASFAGMALANLHRLQLEQELVTELRSMLELRQEFVAGVSHELRTPLTCINGFSSTLAAHWDAIGEEDRRDFVEKIRHHGDELEGLVERFLDYASLEAGRLQANPIKLDIRDEVESALDYLAPLVDGRQVNITGEHLLVHADPSLVRSTLSNLISNAVKYSESGSPVDVAVVDTGASATIEVTDHGIGLADDEAERVFDAFWRARRGVHRLRGTGIGLALVKEYVRLMGGSVTVRSVPDVGSTFSFTLPRHPVDPSG